MTLSVSIQPRDGGWVELGTKNRFEVVPESIQYSGDLAEHGCLDASFLLRVNPRFNHYDIEHFTPIVIQDNGRSVWSGRIIVAPTQYAEDGIINVQCQGWSQHLKDDKAEKLYVTHDLTRWRNCRDHLDCNLTGYTGNFNIDTNGGVINIAVPTGVTAGIGSAGGVYFDAGPSNKISRMVVEYIGGGAASLELECITNNTSVFASGTTTTIDATPIASSSTTFATTFSSPARYILIRMRATAGITGSSTAFVRLRSIKLFTSTTYESGNASALPASTIIKEALTRLCPNVSSDQTQVASTSFYFPEFPIGGGFRSAQEIIDAANEPHAYQFKLSAEPSPVPIFRAQESVPRFYLGMDDDYYFDNPSQDDGREVYSSVVTEYEDVTGERAWVENDTPTSGLSLVRTDLSVSNPSMTTNTTGWFTGLGFNRDTGTFNSTPASGRITADMFTGTILSNYSYGRRYRMTFAAKGASASNMYVGVGTWDGGAGIDTPATQTTVALTTSWAYYTVDFTVPTGLAYSPAMIFQSVAADQYIDDISFQEYSGNIVMRRGFRRVKQVTLPGRSTSAVASAVGQLDLDNAQYPPMRGTLVIQGRIREAGGDSIPVSILPSCVGDAVLIENLRDPNTGALGRQGIITKASYEADSDKATIEIDSATDFVDAIRARLAA